MNESTVEPFEPLRFYVTSASQPGIRHVVDLSANGGSGECSCQSFQFRCHPKLKDGERFTEAVWCRHIKLARTHFLNQALKHASRELAGRRSSVESSALRQTRTVSQDACRAPEANATRAQSSQSKTAETSKDYQPAWLQ